MTTAKARAMQKMIRRTRWICGVSLTAMAAIAGVALFYRQELVAMNQAGGWHGFVITLGGCIGLAIALTVLVATVLPDDIRSAFERGWM